MPIPTSLLRHLANGGSLKSYFAEDGEGGGVAAAVPANNAGAGNIAGIGVGPKGEPGVNLRKKKRVVMGEGAEEMMAKRMKTLAKDGACVKCGAEPGCNIDCKTCKEYSYLDKQVNEDSGILKSFAQAAAATEKREMARAAILDAKPEGYVIPLGGRRDFVKMTIGGDVFWLSRDQRKQYSSRQMALELGTRLREHGWLEEATQAEIEQAAKAVHDQWVEKQKELGHDEHKSPDGKEDYMVDYHELSEPAKDLDRGAVKAVLSVVEERETFAGAPVFTVDMDKVMNSRFGKHPRHRYSKYVGADEVGEEIRQHGRDRKSGDIVLKDSATAVMTYLRRRAVKR